MISPAPTCSPRAASQRGFTLIEVLVALGIVAVALLAGLRATASLTRNAERQTDTLLAQICAENQLVAARLSNQMPGIGDSDISCEQAGHSYQVVVTVAPTPNPSFRRVDAQVNAAGSPILRLSTVIGKY